MAVFKETSTGQTFHIIEQPGDRLSIFPAAADANPTRLYNHPLTCFPIAPAAVQKSVRDGFLTEVPAYETAQKR